MKAIFDGGANMGSFSPSAFQHQPTFEYLHDTFITQFKDRTLLKREQERSNEN